MNPCSECSGMIPGYWVDPMFFTWMSQAPYSVNQPCPFPYAPWQMFGYIPPYGSMSPYHFPMYRMPPDWKSYQGSPAFERMWDSPESPQSPWIKTYHEGG
ncbi:hypothetical protein SAMN05421852_103151 [Thermoflavimicrobium dichotomicum]|uniref:Uncharacterized protein n=1 Tax=Thermoflavimicrobium dichotomicum TaxID=46223 RepID=A0A1I3MQI4_9BACL|nr:hypothetical protein SAMN05421852_103151 [Thermoflavimicrobium dichotomicum]